MVFAGHFKSLPEISMFHFTDQSSPRLEFHPYLHQKNKKGTTENPQRKRFLMENLKITLPTFLRICVNTPRGMIRDLRTFTTPGGYDFYKVMKRLAAGIASGAIDLTQAKEDITQIVKKAEREHTLEAVEKFHAWFAKQDLTWTAPPRGSYKSASGAVTIRLEPELAFLDEGGITSILYLWNLNKPELKNELAAQGLRLLMSNLLGAHYEFGIFNLRKNKIVGADIVDGMAETRVLNNLKLVEQVWRDIHDPTMGVDDTIAHIAELRLPPPPSL